MVAKREADRVVAAVRAYADSRGARIAELEAALRWYIKHVENCEGTDFLSESYAGEEDEPHLSVAREYRERQY